jgi:hypothetical protein
LTAQIERTGSAVVCGDDVVDRCDYGEVTSDVVPHNGDGNPRVDVGVRRGAPRRAGLVVVEDPNMWPIGEEATMALSDVIAEIHGFSDPDSTPTPWSAGLEQVSAADTFWLSTVRPDGRPHVTPLIAVWHGEAIWFSTGPDELKAKNLAENPSCILTTGRSDLVDGALDVVLEGEAEQVTVDAELDPIAAAFTAKYGTGTWDYTVRDGAFTHRVAGGRAIVFRVLPVRALGFRKGDSFSQTTWRFSG